MRVIVMNHTADKILVRDIDNDKDRLELCVLALRGHNIDIIDPFGGVIYTTCTVEGMRRLINALM